MPMRPLALLAALAAGFGLAEAQADPERGEAVFKACKSCHQLGEGARNGVGPHLDGLFGRQAGSLDGFKYSTAMTARGEAGLVWDAAALDAYIANPRAMIPGTRMSYRGLTDDEKRADLIAYLEAATVSDPAADPTAAAPARPEMGAAAMTIAGDPAYGEYLANECLTCHQISGRMEGIPSIVGWPKDAFIRALFEYKTNVRSHQVMRLMTTNLGNEEIAALAAYFQTLEPQ